MDATVPGSGQHGGAAHYQQTATDRTALARRRLLTGGFWLVAGVLITVITYAHAAGGGVYVVAYGPMAFGLFRLVQGLVAATRAD